MKKITTSKFVEAGLERTFEAFADFENCADTISAIVKLELLGDGPIGVGKRFRETRIVFRKEATEEMEISAYDPPRGYEVSAESCGAHFKTAFRFTPEGSGTRVDVEISATPISLAAKLMSPLGGMMLRSCAKAFETDLEELHALAEGQGARLATT